MKKKQCLRRTRKKGGAIIGEGQQGIAFSPPLLCTNPEDSPHLNSGRASPFTKRKKKYVTKIASADVAKTEMNAARNLLSFDPKSKFTAPALGQCTASKAQTNVNYAGRNDIGPRGLDTLIFSQYRGNALMNIYGNYDDNHNMDVPIDDIRNIIVSVCILMNQVSKELNGRAGVLHNDAHPGNIVFDDVTLISTLIDFGFAIKNAPEVASKLAIGDTNVPVTNDIWKIFEFSIYSLFNIPNIAVKLLALDDKMATWHDDASLIIKKKNRNEATQKEFLHLSNTLMKLIQDSELKELAKKIRDRSYSPIGRRPSIASTVYSSNSE